MSKQEKYENIRFETKTCIINNTRTSIVDLVAETNKYLYRIRFYPNKTFESFKNTDLIGFYNFPKNSKYAMELMAATYALRDEIYSFLLLEEGSKEYNEAWWKIKNKVQ
jgi:hypothetical protein